MFALVPVETSGGAPANRPRDLGETPLQPQHAKAARNARFALLTGFGLAVLMALLPLTPARAEEGPGLLTLSGRGVVSAAPDVATIILGVVTEAKTAAEALTQNTARLARVFEALDMLEVAEKDRQTSGLSVQPRWVYPERTENEAPRIVGYTVSNTVTVRLDQMDQVGAAIDTLIRDGANQFQSLSFGVRDPSALREQALRAAIAAARVKADVFAEGLGVALGPVQAVSEEWANNAPAPMMRLEMAMASDSAPVPVASGEVSYEATVTVVWQLDQ